MLLANITRVNKHGNQKDRYSRPFIIFPGTHASIPAQMHFKPAISAR